jgi:hypothetical protein
MTTLEDDTIYWMNYALIGTKVSASYQEGVPAESHRRRAGRLDCSRWEPKLETVCDGGAGLGDLIVLDGNPN